MTGLSGAAIAAAAAAVKLRAEKQLGVFTLRTKTASPKRLDNTSRRGRLKCLSGILRGPIPF